MQVEVYQKLAGKSRPAAGNKALAESALALADRAIEADDLDAAEQLLKVASITAGKARAADLLKQAKARGEELADQKREAEAVRKAEEVIAKNADDAAANLTLGKYFCVSRDDWEQGLPHLAKGSDATLKELAAKSLPSPTDPAALSALGDAWWDAAEIRKGKEAEPLRRRATLVLRSVARAFGPREDQGGKASARTRRLGRSEAEPGREAERGRGDDRIAAGRKCHAQIPADSGRNVPDGLAADGARPRGQ